MAIHFSGTHWRQLGVDGVQFIAISGDSQSSHTHIAKCVANLGHQIKPLRRLDG